MRSTFNKFIIAFTSLFLIFINSTQAQNVRNYLWQLEYGQYFRECMSSATTGMEPAMPFDTYESHSQQRLTANNYCHIYAVEQARATLLLPTQVQNTAEYLWQQVYDLNFRECMSSATTGMEPAMPFDTYELHSQPRVTTNNYCHIYAVERTPSALSLLQAAE